MSEYSPRPLSVSGKKMTSGTSTFLRPDWSKMEMLERWTDSASSIDRWILEPWTWLVQPSTTFQHLWTLTLPHFWPSPHVCLCCPPPPESILVILDTTRNVKHTSAEPVWGSNVSFRSMNNHNMIFCMKKERRTKHSRVSNKPVNLHSLHLYNTALTCSAVATAPKLNSRTFPD